MPKALVDGAALQSTSGTIARLCVSRERHRSGRALSPAWSLGAAYERERHAHARFAIVWGAASVADGPTAVALLFHRCRR